MTVIEGLVFRLRRSFHPPDAISTLWQAELPNYSGLSYAIVQFLMPLKNWE
jgi:hypothetical protein